MKSAQSLATLALVATLALALAAGGCASRIGDDCTTNTDCSPDGDRICDTSVEGSGYCTIEGCDTGTCPGEASCVRFFPASFLTPRNDCRQSTALNNGCSKDEVCLTSTGACAPRSIERRYCMLSCLTDQDCRSNYRCVRTGDVATGGLAGAEAVPKASGAVSNVRFCAFDPASK